MKANEAAVARGCSAYSLARVYSDPINNEPAGKENEGDGYDHVTYQQQHTTDKENIYDHMSKPNDSFTQNKNNTHQSQHIFDSMLL